MASVILEYNRQENKWRTSGDVDFNPDAPRWCYVATLEKEIADSFIEKMKDFHQGRLDFRFSVLDNIILLLRMHIEQFTAEKKQKE